VTTSDNPQVDIVLSANGYVNRGNKKRVDLTWSGVTAGNVDIFRDGNVIGTTTASSGAYNDNLGKGGGSSYTYHVCESGGSNCSDPVTVNF
jgi:hypothetical protein